MDKNAKTTTTARTTIHTVFPLQMSQLGHYSHANTMLLLVLDLTDEVDYAKVVELAMALVVELVD